MDIEYIRDNSAESELLDLNYDGKHLTILFRMDEPEIDVKIEIPTSHVLCPFSYKSTSGISKICRLDIVDLKKQLTVNQNGIIVPSDNFGLLMRELRNGYGLAYGLQISTNPRIIRFTGSSLLLACITCDIEQIQITEIDDNPSETHK